MENLRFKLDLQTFAGQETGPAMRYELLTYINTAPKTTAQYELMGEGFTEMTESLNPQTKESGYIHQKSKSNSVTGYAPEYAFTAEYIKGDPVCEYIASIGNGRLIGADAETDIVNVMLYKRAEEGEEEDLYEAWQQKIAVKCDQVNGGPGQDSMPLTGSLLYKGDPVKGTFNIKTKAFTPNAAAAA